VIRRALAAAVGIALAAAASAGASPAHAAQLQLDGSTNYDSASSSTTSTTQALSTGLGPTASGASLRLISQTDWVTGTGSSATFNIEVVPTLGPSNEAADVEVDVLVYDMLGSRSALTNSLAADGLHEGYVLAHPISANLGRFTVGPGGAITIRIPVGGRYGQLHLDRSGVYPVAVELRPLGGLTPLAWFMTHLLYVPAPPSAARLKVAWVVPIHAPPVAPAQAGTDPPEIPAPVSTLVSALAAYPQVALTVDATPDTISTLETDNQATVNELGQALAGRELLANTWVPSSVPAMLEDGLSDELSLSLTRGDDALTAALGVNVTGQSWVQQGPVNPETLTFLRGTQFDRVVLPESDLDPSPFTKTLVQPFEVTGSDQTPIRAAAADGGLAAHFTDQPDPVLAAHQLLADLTQIYADAPNDPDRGVVVIPPANWTPSSAFLDAFLAGLADSPVLSSVDLDSYFDSVPPAVVPGGGTLVRQLVVDDTSIRNQAAALRANDQRAARAELDALARTLPDDSTIYPGLERLLLEVPSTDLTATQRDAWLAALNHGVRSIGNLIQLPGSRTVTMTARKGQLPITILSLSDEPLNVVLQVQSGALEFPGSTTSGIVQYPLTLRKGTTIKVLTVRARTSGAFPLYVSVLTGDGSVPLIQTKMQVQSTALNGVGIILSVGAALFLVAWWGRHAWRARRDAAKGQVSRRHASGRARFGEGGPLPAGGQ